MNNEAVTEWRIATTKIFIQRTTIDLVDVLFLMESCTIPEYNIRHFKDLLSDALNQLSCKMQNTISDVVAGLFEKTTRIPKHATIYEYQEEEYDAEAFKDFVRQTMHAIIKERCGEIIKPMNCEIERLQQIINAAKERSRSAIFETCKNIEMHTKNIAMMPETKKLEHVWDKIQTKIKGMKKLVHEELLWIFDLYFTRIELCLIGFMKKLESKIDNIVAFFELAIPGIVNDRTHKLRKNFTIDGIKYQLRHLRRDFSFIVDLSTEKFLDDIQWAGTVKGVDDYLKEVAEKMEEHLEELLRCSTKVEKLVRVSEAQRRLSRTDFH